MTTIHDMSSLAVAHGFMRPVRFTDAVVADCVYTSGKCATKPPERIDAVIVGAAKALTSYRKGTHSVSFSLRRETPKGDGRQADLDLVLLEATGDQGGYYIVAKRDESFAAVQEASVA